MWCGAVWCGWVWTLAGPPQEAVDATGERRYSLLPVIIMGLSPVTPSFPSNSQSRQNHNLSSVTEPLLTNSTDVDLGFGAALVNKCYFTCSIWNASDYDALLMYVMYVDNLG